MLAKTIIALSTAFVLGTATAAAMTNAKAKNSRAAFAQSGPAAVYAPNRMVVGHDTGGAAIFRGQLTPACPLSLKQQSRC